jgi:WhiB family redox-sensing transcriptional regulator
LTPVATTNSRIPTSLTENWRRYAACRSLGPANFFPEVDLAGRSFTTSALTTQTLAAKAICATCPVRVSCYDYAIDNEIYFGIWGGFSMTRPARRRRGERTTTLAS